MRSQFKINFAYLTAFRGGGGLEKFNKALMCALSEADEYQCNFMGLHDRTHDKAYTGQAEWTSGNGSKLGFVRQVVLQARQADVLVLGHINLAIIGLLAKRLNPSLQLIMVCHGIEVWEPLLGLKRRVIKKVDRFVAVSSYTKQELVKKQKISASKISVLHNTFDPYFEFPAHFKKQTNLTERYDISDYDTVVFTLCRLASSEGYKGYDRVIQALAEWNKPFKYIIGGKYDDEEYTRLQHLIAKHGLKDKVVLAGFIPDEEVAHYYQLADVFVMPSTGEGFGIVYIESMAYGTPVVAGNADGSVDALDNGNLGVLVDPLDINDILKGIEQAIHSNLIDKDLSDAVRKKFGFQAYRQQLLSILSSLGIQSQ